MVTPRPECFRRGLERDGAESVDQWGDWFDEEDRYIAAEHPQRRARLIVAGSPIEPYDPTIEVVVLTSSIPGSGSITGASSSGEVTIRDFDPGDQDTFREIVQAGMQDRWGDAFDWDANPDIDDVWETYVLANNADVLVAETDGVVVATGVLLPDAAHAGRLVRMSVARDLRRQGHATALVAALVERASARAMTSVFVRTDTVWPDAVALYQSCGFTITNQTKTETDFELALQPSAPAATPAAIPA